MATRRTLCVSLVGVLFFASLSVRHIAQLVLMLFDVVVATYTGTRIYAHLMPFSCSSVCA